MKPENPASRAWTIAAIPVALAGVSLVVNDPDPRHWKAMVGYGLIACAVLIPLAAVCLTRRDSTKRKRKLKRARVIVQSLIDQGDKLSHDPGIVHRAVDTGSGLFTILSPTPPPSPLEQWREVVGNKLNHEPFTPGKGNWALTQQGNRYEDVLNRLREIEADLENCISED